MHLLVSAVALLSQSAAVFGVAVPKPAPAAASVQVAAENAPVHAVVAEEVKPEEQLNGNILERTPTTLLTSFHPTPVGPRAEPPTQPPLFPPPPPNPFWPPLPAPPTPKIPSDFSPHCHLKTQEECDRIR